MCPLQAVLLGMLHSSQIGPAPAYQVATTTSRQRGVKGRIHPHDPPHTHTPHTPPPPHHPRPAGLQQDPPEGVNASPQAENIMHWNAIIFGPDGELLCCPTGRVDT